MKQDSNNSKPFLYLVQSAGKLPELYNDLQSERSDVLSLTWKEKVEGAIYFPKSSWTEGRNRLYEESVKNPSYLYYIFLDDDVEFSKGSWRDFEDELLKYNPAIAVPYLAEYGSGDAFNDLRLDSQTCYYFDAMYNAFHRDVVMDGLILPYYGNFDQKSWWYSQWIVIHLANLFFPNHILQINTVWINNLKHEDYPKNNDFKPISKWFNKEVLTPRTSIFQNLFKRVAFNIRWKPLRWLIWKPRPPFPKLNSYRVPERQKRQKINVNREMWSTDLAD